MAGEYQNSSEYIQHHLTNLTYGRFENGEWGWAHGAEDIAEMGFYAIHVDTTFGRIEQDAYATLQLQAGYQITDMFEVQANVANVTDTKRLASLYWEQAYYAAPRSFTLTLRGRF